MAKSGGRNACHHGRHRGHQKCRATGLPCAVTAQQPAVALGGRGRAPSSSSRTRTGSLYATDSSGREALIGCGAVLDHFRVAMAAAGWTANVDRFPNPNNPLHVASVDFTPMEFVTDGHRQPRGCDTAAPHRPAALRRATGLGCVRDAVARRRSAPTPYASTSFPTNLRPRAGGSLSAHRITAPLRLVVSRRTRLVDSGHSRSLEGIPHELTGVGGRERPRRRRTKLPRDPAIRQARSEFGEDHSKVVVLSTYDDERRQRAACGEMLSAVLLEATMVGLATCTLTHITELPASRNDRRRADRPEPPHPRCWSASAWRLESTNSLPLPPGGRSTRCSRSWPKLTARPPRLDVVAEPRSASAGATCRHSHHRPPSWSASTVRGPRSTPPCGPSTRQSVAISRCASCTPSTRTITQTPITEDAARELAAAEIAVRHAFTAVESTDKPVKIEVEILQKTADPGADRGLTMGRNAVRRLDGSQTQQPGPDRFHRSGIGVIRRALPGRRRPRTRPAPGETTAGWSPNWTSLRHRTGCYGARWKRRDFAGAPLAC